MMSSFEILINVIVLALLAAAVYTDIRERRIPNLFTLPSIGFGLVLNGMAGSQALVISLQGLALGAFIFLVPFALGWMGAGDVKLLAALGALKGPGFVLITVLIGAIAGGVFAIALLTRQGKLLAALRFLLVFWRYPVARDGEPLGRMPYGPALAIGAAAALYMQWGWWQIW